MRIEKNPSEKNNWNKFEPHVQMQILLDYYRNIVYDANREIHDLLIRAKKKGFYLSEMGELRPEIRKIDVDELINYMYLSKILTGHLRNITKTYYPKKYASIINSLRRAIETWAKNNLK